MNDEMAIGLPILAGYLIFITVFGIWIGTRQKKSTKGYFLGGRSFTWWMIGASLLATNLSSTQMTAQSGEAFRSGLAAANPQMMGGIMMVVSAMFFIPMYMRKGFFTIPQFLETRFSKSCKIINSVVIVIDGFLKAPIGIYAGSLAIIKVFNLCESDLWLVALIMGGTVGLYAVIGGLASVVMTDVIQVSILLIGGVVVLIVGLNQLPDIGIFWQEMKTEGKLEMILPWGSSKFSWEAVISGLALFSMVWATSNSGMLQRVLGAKDLREAQVGMIFAGYLKIAAVFLIVFPGIIALYLYPTENPEGVYAVMVRDTLGPVFSALVVAALLAALMSTQDSGVCNVSSIVALDLYPLIHKNTTEKRALLVGRITGALMLTFGIAMAPIMAGQDSLYMYMMKIGTFLIFPIGVCYLGGRFVKRINHQGTLFVLIVGPTWGLANLLLTTVDGLKQYAPEFMETSPFILGFFYAIIYFFLQLFVSLLFPAPRPEQVDFMTAKDDDVDDGHEENRAWYQTRKFWYITFFACWISVYVIF